MRLALNYQRVDPTQGGAETYVADLCRALVGAGHQVDLYAESWREGAVAEGVKCVAVAATGRTRLERLWSFARNSETALRQVSYDCTVGLINTWHHDVIIPQGGVHRGSMAANSRRFTEGWQRAVYRLGKQSNPKFWVHQAIERRQYESSRQAKVIAVSNLLKEQLLQYHHVPRTRIHVIPNAIDPAQLMVAHPGAVRCAFRNKVGLLPGDLVGLFVGHNYKLKGLGPLLHALAERTRRQPTARPIHLVVCGGGSARFARRLINRLGLKATVHLLGYWPDVRAAFWSSDFFVLPTFYDPCSLAVFEALACGLPVITTACNGASELMTDGREGTIVSAPTALGEMVQALDHMADDAHPQAHGRRAASILGSAHVVRRPRRPMADQGVLEEVAARPEVVAANRMGMSWGSWAVARQANGSSEIVVPRVSSIPERITMQAILLAGGTGTRLRPFTHVFPKPLMPLGEADPMPIIEVVLRQLARAGFGEVAVITGYLKELIEAFCGDGRKFGTRLTYHREVSPLGTAGGLTLIDRPTRPVLVINGDILTTLDYAAMFAFHHAHQGLVAATITASYPREVKIDFGVLEFGADPHILTGYREKPAFAFQVSMGVYILDPIAWDYLVPGQPLTMPELLETMRGAGHPVHCFRQECYWLDIGRHDDYATANEIFEARRASFLGEPVRLPLRGPHSRRTQAESTSMDDTENPAGATVGRD